MYSNNRVTMKRLLLIVSALVGLNTPLDAQGIKGVSVGNPRMAHRGESMAVQMDLDLARLEVDPNLAVILTPRLLNGRDSVELPSVGIYGRRRYFYYTRNGADLAAINRGGDFRASEKPDSIVYSASCPYQPWMDGATLVLDRQDYGCCRTLLDEQRDVLGLYEAPFVYVPRFIYIRPEADTVKVFAIDGSAFIDFPVNQTVIYPDYRRNTAELQKIEDTIDSIRTDADVSITSIWLKGYASPESPYAHNTKLAIGRTEALKKYIQQLYHFDDGSIETDYEPEDWQGLRRYVDRSNLSHRAEILALIDSDLDPDAKEARIKRTYPEEYRFLLDHCYPALRHTDYRISYTVHVYTDVEAIRRVLKEKPGKLSLNELYLVAQSCEPGSDEFESLFETAVRMFPEDETANLNAANAAMQRNDLKSAATYLSRSGDSPQAVYARGVYEMLTQHYDAAEELFARAEAAGIAEAAEGLEAIAKIRKQTFKQ